MIQTWPTRSDFDLSGLRIVESEMLLPLSVMVDTDNKTITCRDVYKFLFRVFGPTDDVVKFCCDHALRKVGRSIEKRVAHLRMMDMIYSHGVVLSSKPYML